MFEAVVQIVQEHVEHAFFQMNDELRSNKDLRQQHSKYVERMTHHCEVGSRWTEAAEFSACERQAHATWLLRNAVLDSRIANARQNNHMSVIFAVSH